MSSLCNHNATWSLSSGTSQSMREQVLLNPDSVQLMDLGMEEWLRFARLFAEEVNYYGLDNKKNGKWTSFFPEISNIEGLANQANALLKNENADEVGSIAPHVALFISFVKLLEFSRTRLNGLTRRHLDFYFKEVLGMEPKPATPDEVFILFELSKNAKPQKVDQGFLLKGGKDLNGKERLYETTDEYIVGAAQVAELRNSFNDGSNGVYASIVANSYDGLGTNFPEDNIQWWPFGHSDAESKFQDQLPFANLGWAVGSKIFLMKEGVRKVSLVYSFVSNISPDEATILSHLKTCLTVQFSGEKELISADVDSIKAIGKILTINLIIGADKDPVVTYNEAVHEMPLKTKFPVAICTINQEIENAYEVYEILSTKTISNLQIDLDVSSMVDIVLENDQGPIDSNKPFLPFGINPKSGANFYVSAYEALQKNWKKITIDHNWDNAPGNLSAHYEKYTTQFRDNPSSSAYVDSSPTKIISNNDHFTFEVEILEDGVWKKKEDGFNINSGKLFETIDSNNIIISRGNSGSAESSGSSESFTSSGSTGTIGVQRDTGMPGAFGVSRSYKGKILKSIDQHANAGMKKIQDLITEELEFYPSLGSLSFGNQASITSKLSAQAKEGFIKLQLGQSFLHELYPSLFSVAMLLIAQETDVELPKTPYQPTASSLTMSYSASETQSFQVGTSSFLVDHFHQYPFGVSRNEDHILGQNVSALSILPRISDGSLYIGLSDLEPLSVISLLVGVVNGSENPDAELQYEGEEKIQWSILINNKWVGLNENNLIADETDNFLKSGIVKFNIPEDVNNDNSLLPSGLSWIKADNVKSHDAVCRVQNIHAQAIKARFKNNENETSHLTTGIEAGSITKAVIRLSNIKSLSQPYSSFGGASIQSDKLFYQDTSERLKHRRRAVKRWDYEHIILSKFSEIYKTACLNHTDDVSTLSPGEIRIVVIPDIRNDNIFNPYKPKVSKAVRNEIETHVNQLNSLHVDARVVNPTYEEVKVKVKVRFQENLDEVYYLNQLKTDIASYLAPWAFDQNALVEFGGTINESKIIFFMEKLSYVDYVADVILYHRLDQDISKRSIEVTNPRSILTSVPVLDHEVTIEPLKCNLNN